jgi:putative Mg2+ transporter-C (MgtC) family protein
MGPDLPLWEGILRLLLALALAAAIGLEREFREQEAGLRTHILVATGACLFVLVGNYAWEDLRFGNNVGVVLDPSRVVAYVITGIGFLGAGAILKDGVNVRGLTTAASLWVTAAIGVTSAAGEYVWAVTVAAIILISLWPLRRLADALDLRKRRSARLCVELRADGRVADVASALEEQGVRVRSIRVTDQIDIRRVDLVLVGVASPDAALLDAVGDVPQVRSASLAG